MKAHDRRDGLEMVGEVTRQDLGDQLVSSLIHGAHLADVAGELSRLDELGHGRLQRQRRVPICQASRRTHSLGQGGWGNYEAETQRGQHRLGERAYIDDPTTGVDRVQRVEGTTAEAEFTVV